MGSPMSARRPKTNCPTPYAAMNRESIVPSWVVEKNPSWFISGLAPATPSRAEW